MSAAKNIIHLHQPMPANFIPPSLEECLLHAAKIGLTERDANRFWLFYDAKDWFVGRNKMKRWHSSMALWKLNSNDSTKPINGAETVILGREYERILLRITTLKSQYSDHQAWDAKDKLELQTLKSRREVLRGKLGIEV